MTGNSNTITVRGNTVIYDTKTKHWSIDGVDESNILTLNPELHKIVVNELRNKVKAFRDKLVEERKVKQIETQKEKIERQKRFKKTIGKLFGKDFKLTFIDLEKVGGRYADQLVITKKGGVIGRIEYSPTVSDGWNSKRTNKPWETSVGYKVIRYKTLEKAVERTIERIEEKLRILKVQQDSADKEKSTNKDITQRLTEHGFEFDELHQNRTTKRVAVSTIKTNKDGYVLEVVGVINNTETLEVRDVQVNGKFTLDQLKQLSKAVEKIGGEVVYNSRR